MRSSHPKFWDFVVGLLLILLLGTYAVAQLGRSREVANRVKCASNLRQIGQAMLLYSNENRGAYPRTIFDINNPKPTWGTPYEGDPKLGPEPADKTKQLFHPDKCDVAPKPNDVTAALFLLVRTQEITSEVFICPSTGLTRFDYGGGKNTPENVTNWLGNQSLAEHLSYSLADPYPSKDAVAKKFKMNNMLGPEFALAGDINPGIDALTKVNVTSTAAELRKVNSINHNQDGQNFLFGDGHVEFTTNVFVGMKRDNVYTYGPSGDDAKDKGGDGIVGAPTSASDSVLLPTAKDLGVVDDNGQLTEAGKKSRAAAIEAMRPVTPAEQEATRQKVLGTFRRADGATMTISDGKIEISAPKAVMTFKFAGLDKHAAMLNIARTDGGPEEKAIIEVQSDGLKINGSQLAGSWKRQ